MQALCPECNQKKGAKMAGRMGLAYNRAMRREGVAGAINTILDEVIAPGDVCSVILPCRYGKSDVIRLGTLELMDISRAAFGISLAPFDTIVGQTVRQRKLRQMIKRYGLSVRGAQLLATTLDSTRAIESLLERVRTGKPIPEFLFSMTTQLFALQCGPNSDSDHTYMGQKFRDLCVAVLKRYRMPLVIFPDECQYTSDINYWGTSFQQLLDDNLILGVPLTATAERADARPMPGFIVEEIGEKEFMARFYRRRPDLPPGKVMQEDYVGTKRTYLLKAHYQYSDREAAREDPPALCKTELIPVHVKLEWLGEEVPGVEYLHEVKDEALARRLSHQAIRTPRVIDEIARIGILKFQGLRRTLPHVLAIVYCDTDASGEENPSQPGPVRDDHLALVEKSLQDAARAAGLPLSIVKITMNTPDPAGCLAAFEGDPEMGQPGVGDMALAKNMGSVGLDAPPVVLTIDCSAIRSGAAWKQRVQRASTPYEYAPGQRLNMAWHITIWDPMVAANWERLFVAQGIDAPQTCTEHVDLYHQEVVDEPESVAKPSANIGTAHVAGVFHQEGQSAPAQVLALRNAFAEQNPHLAKLLVSLSDIDFYRLFQDLTTAQTRAAAPKEPPPQVSPTTTACNSGQDRVRVNAIYNSANKLLTGKELKRAARPDADFEYVAKDNAAQIKTRAGVSPSVSLKIDEQVDLEIHRRCARAARALAREQGITDVKIIRNVRENWKRQDEPPDLAFLQDLCD
jgi:hypothetical protein